MKQWLNGKGNLVTLRWAFNKIFSIWKFMSTFDSMVSVSLHCKVLPKGHNKYYAKGASTHDLSTQRLVCKGLGAATLNFNAH